jgi:hypothetical protein
MMLVQAKNGKPAAEALRSAEFATLTSRAVTDNARALVEQVYALIIAEEKRTKPRQRQRASKAAAFKRGLGGFLGDLMRAAGSGVPWVYRAVSQKHFTGDVVSYRDFQSLRLALKALKLIEEAKSVQQWTAFGPGKGWATRFRATPKLVEMAAACGVLAADADDHFVRELPKKPLVLRAGSKRTIRGEKTQGRMMKIAYNSDVRAMEQTIVDLNTFLDQFSICGGAHRGYIRGFNEGDHPAFHWNLGGRLYSQGRDNYQNLDSAQRLRMTIGGEAVCELDIRASYLTIFQARQGQPLDFIGDPYALPGLGSKARDVVKTFITATFGGSEFPVYWSREMGRSYRERTGKGLGKQYPITEIRASVTQAYPLLAGLRRAANTSPIWAELMFLESEAVLGTMLALKDRGIPSLSVHDSLIVQQSQAPLAEGILKEIYRFTTTATPQIETKRQ